MPADQGIRIASSRRLSAASKAISKPRAVTAAKKALSQVPATDRARRARHSLIRKQPLGTPTCSLHGPKHAVLHIHHITVRPQGTVDRKRQAQD